jgi:hypothetical protein
MAADGIICGTGEFQVVLAADGLPLFDSDGAPVEARDLPCLDCTFGWVALAPEAPFPAARSVEARALDPTPFLTSAAAPWRMGGMGRSPPCAA